jgi:hypothetical protein
LFWLGWLNDGTVVKLINSSLSWGGRMGLVHFGISPRWRASFRFLFCSGQILLSERELGLELR